MGTAVAIAAFLIITSPLGRRSGAHMNPAITASYFWLGRYIAEMPPSTLRPTSEARSRGSSWQVRSRAGVCPLPRCGISSQFRACTEALPQCSLSSAYRP
jgi:hypothetical protein